MEIKTLTMTRKEFKQYKETHDPADYSYYHFLDHRNRRMYVVYETASQLGGFLFLYKLPIDKACGLWYNRGGAGRADHGREGPNSRSDTPYANFQILLATDHMPQFFPKTAHKVRIADRAHIWQFFNASSRPG